MFPWQLAMGGMSALSGLMGQGSYNVNGTTTADIRWLNKLAKEAYALGNTIPGSAPDEQAAMASMGAYADRSFKNSEDQMLAARGANGGQADAGTLDNFLGGLSAQHEGGKMGAIAPMFQQFIANRRNLKFGTAAGLFQQAGSLALGGQSVAQNAPQQGAGGLEALAQAIGFSQSRKSQNWQAGGAPAPVAGSASGSMTTAPNGLPGQMAPRTAPPLVGGWGQDPAWGNNG